MTNNFKKTLAFISAITLSMTMTGVAYAEDATEAVTGTTSSTEVVSETETTSETENESAVATPDDATTAETLYGGASAENIKAYGDVNSDEEINEKDAVVVLRFYAENLASSGKVKTIEEFLANEAETTETATGETDSVETTEAATGETDSVETTETATGETDSVETTEAATGETKSVEATTEGETESATVAVDANNSNDGGVMDTTVESTESTEDTSAEETTEAAAPLLGDVNSDGVVDQKDAVSILSFYAVSLVDKSVDNKVTVETQDTTEATEEASSETTDATDASSETTDATEETSGAATTEASSETVEATEATETTNPVK